jgi:hypothetical protein
VGIDCVYLSMVMCAQISCEEVLVVLKLIAAGGVRRYKCDCRRCWCRKCNLWLLLNRRASGLLVISLYLFSVYTLLEVLLL